MPAPHTHIPQSCFTWTALLRAGCSLVGMWYSTEQCEELCSTCCVSVHTATFAPVTGRILLHKTSAIFYPALSTFIGLSGRPVIFIWYFLQNHTHQFIFHFPDMHRLASSVLRGSQQSIIGPHASFKHQPNPPDGTSSRLHQLADNTIQSLLNKTI